VSTPVRAVAVPLECSLPAGRVLLALRDEPWPFALTGRWAGGGALVGSSPLALLEAGADPFATLDALPPATGSAVVGGGWFGWLGYGLGARVEALPPPPPRPRPLPDAQLAYYDNVLRLDADGRWWFEALVTPERKAALDARLDAIRDRLARAPATEFAAPGPFRLRAPGAAGHVAAVRECIERIAAGEIFQANLCLRLETEWEGDVAALFARAAAALEPAYGACFPAPWGGVASLSPELFLRRRGRVVTTGPIKGTSPRGDDPAVLQGSEKDRAEHVMIVDLMRNDLGRVSEYGSVVAPEAPEAQAHPGVWHLVSEVRGRLARDAGDGDLLRATFPPGSVTGAPKVQAMHVIAELEATGREVYTGAIGFASPLAGLELSVAIRTFEARDGLLWLGAGGGIVADSNPEAELEECLVKARPLVEAVGGRIEVGSEISAEVSTAGGEVAVPPRAVPPPRTAPPALGPDRRRPDPALGVFETLLARDGEAENVDAHLARLAASLQALYGTAPPDDLVARVRALAREATEPSALRIVAVPGAPVELSLAPRRPRTLPIVLRPFTLPGGLGPHKWLDRHLLDALAAGGATPLLIDADGSVLEAAWANVLIRRDGRLLTPPDDGRILPGTARPAAEPAELTLHDLETAGELLVSSSLAGVVPAILAGR
jgi:para-aminobenzoate synthetase/4-amino-4-deoxychorismate lyase